MQPGCWGSVRPEDRNEIVFGGHVDFSDIHTTGERIAEMAVFHEHEFQYSHSQNGIMPLPLAKDGIKGLYYRKYDLSMCTYCSGVNGLMLAAIRHVCKGKAWDDVEVLTGKAMRPSPGKHKTILLGKCMHQNHKDHPDIRALIAVKGCPPKPADMLKALHRAGIDADPGLFDNIQQLPGLFMARYDSDPEFDAAFYKIV
jgi:hypothetical protein